MLVNDALYVHGGKVDQSNQFSYASAPNTNEVLFLSLSSGFSAQSPPWTLVSSSTNSSTSLAWHAISAFNTTHALLFGGLPDPNSQTVLLTRADSAAILDVSARTSPEWIPEPSSWGGQPIRRHRHSSATSRTGNVFIIGGERSDGSRVAFSDHFYFAGSTLSFNPLPTSNAPPDLYGHASVILDGRMLVFGGYSPSQSVLLPFSTIWVLDLSTMEWSVISTDTSPLPAPRVAFAAAVIGSGRVIIQGGCDSSFQTNFADGWVLDTTTNPWKWSSVDALSQVGARRDHFAVSFGGQVIFGFGKQFTLVISLTLMFVQVIQITDQHLLHWTFIILPQAHLVPPIRDPRQVPRRREPYHQSLQLLTLHPNLLTLLVQTHLRPPPPPTILGTAMRQPLPWELFSGFLVFSQSDWEQRTTLAGVENWTEDANLWL